MKQKSMVKLYTVHVGKTTTVKIFKKMIFLKLILVSKKDFELILTSMGFLEHMNISDSLDIH